MVSKRTFPGQHGAERVQNMDTIQGNQEVLLMCKKFLRCQHSWHDKIPRHIFFMRFVWYFLCDSMSHSLKALHDKALRKEVSVVNTNTLQTFPVCWICICLKNERQRCDMKLWQHKNGGGKDLKNNSQIEKKNCVKVKTEWTLWFFLQTKDTNKKLSLFLPYHLLFAKAIILKLNSNELRMNRKKKSSYLIVLYFVLINSWKLRLIFWRAKLDMTWSNLSIFW